MGWGGGREGVRRPVRKPVWRSRRDKRKVWPGVEQLRAVSQTCPLFRKRSQKDMLVD